MQLGSLIIFARRFVRFTGCYVAHMGRLLLVLASTLFVCSALAEHWSIPKPPAVLNFALQDKWEVPENGSFKGPEAPRKTDSDADGIRDDYQYAIDREYGEDELARRYTLLMVRVLQLAMENEGEYAWAAFGYFSQLDYCVQILGKSQRVGEPFIMPMVFDTHSSAREYFEKTASLRSWIGEYPSPNKVCAQ